MSAMLITPSTLDFEPLHFSVPAPWAGHIPFSNWLIEALKPQTFVELGAYSGISYMSFCQAIAQQQLTTRAWAIDTWQGDPHAGFYNDSIYTQLRDKHDPLFGHYSTLLRSTFDEALQHFDDNSIDLLHIDGLHTYEAVRHDFESWKPKLTQRGVVLFHDTCVFQSDFGVHKLWRELKEKYPNINFTHSNGLGVLLVGRNPSESLLELCAPQNAALQTATFAKLGERFEQRAQRMQLDKQVRDLQQQLATEVAAGQQRHNWIVLQDQQLEKLQLQVDALTSLKEQQLEQLQQQDDALASLKHQNTRTHIQLQRTQQELSDLYQSKSWRATAIFRKTFNLLRQVKRFGHLALKGMKYLARGDLRGLFARMASTRQERQHPSFLVNPIPGQAIHCGILTTPHTLFLAELLAQRLQHHGWKVETFTQEPAHFSHDLYFVLCPQIFKNLPPGNKRIVYQLEQTNSSRWFTPSYLNLLNQSLAVLDYNIDNIRFLSDKGIHYPHVYYMPVGASVQCPQGITKNHSFDVLFYGDSLSSPRRRLMLEALQSRFRVEIVNDLFGEAMRAKIAQARLVINLHYHDKALLETPRILESLSLGTAVVSESASNQLEFSYLASAVSFFDEGSIECMLSAVQQALDNPLPAQTRDAALSFAQTQFNFFLDRFLLGLKLLPNDIVNQLQLPIPAEAKRFCLSLPETPTRRDLFLQQPPEDCVLFDGLRQNPGWIGCGLSYLALTQHALCHRLPSITVMEDDVTLPPSFEADFARIQRYLQQVHCSQWDVFSGLIASLHPDTQVLHAEEFEGRTFVTIDKMTSMVFNIYSAQFLHKLQAWDPDDLDAENNTIDRFIERQGSLRVIVQLPFLAGHREEVTSTLWGFQNSQYADLIATSESKLQQLTARWRSTFQLQSKYDLEP